MVGQNGNKEWNLFEIKAADDAMRWKVERFLYCHVRILDCLFSEKIIHAEIEEGNGVYVIRLFEYGTGAEITEYTSLVDIERRW